MFNIPFFDILDIVVLYLSLTYNENSLYVCTFLRQIVCYICYTELGYVPVLDILNAIRGKRVDLQVVGDHQDVLHRLWTQAQGVEVHVVDDLKQKGHN